MKNLYDELVGEIRNCISEHGYPDADDVEHVAEICNAVFSHLPDRSKAILESLIKYTHGFGVEGNEIERSLQRLIRSLQVESTKSRLTEIAAEEDPFGVLSTPQFELEEDDRSRALKLTSEIKQLVQVSQSIDASHKTRLFKRITAVEIEITKIKGNFDVILGGMSDFGEALGKFGKDVKPLVDRMKEIRSLTRAKTSDYDQLPPPDETKELPHPDDFDQT